MTGARPESTLLPRLVLAGVATAAMAVALIALQRASSARMAAAGISEPPVPGLPIRGEADVFRARPGTEMMVPDERRRAGAHPRSLATFHALRSYPGAPPRVPHGLTPVEFRTSRCNTCHERGGFVQRFGTYAPVTPHPELTACLLCHATNGQLAGVALPSTGPNDQCRQCHVGTPVLFRETGIDWRPAAFPRLDRRVDGVPVIPHDLSLRGRCIACHGGPGAVAEIRTPHPERVNCRQCHVALDGGAGEYVRQPAAARTGSVP